MPLRGGWSTGIRLDISGETNVGTDAQAVSPGYFATMGIPLLQGRLLTAGDRDGQPLVVVVNREFVRRFLPNVDPIGRRLRWDEWVTIVGVVSDIRRSGKEQPVRPGIYVPAEQSTASPVTLSDFAVRASGDPRRLVSAIQAQVWELDRNQPVTGVQTLAEMVSVSVSQRRFETLLLLAFAAVAVGLAVIGVFGVLSYTVSQRTPEWGVRIALGAAPSSILRLVIRQAGWLVAAGVSLGLCGAFALTRFLESMLFEVHRNDAATYLACVALVAVVAIAASLIPARRGSKVDPMVALRYE
jgi:predicted permease